MPWPVKISRTTSLVVIILCGLAILLPLKDAWTQEVAAWRIPEALPPVQPGDSVNTVTDTATVPGSPPGLGVDTFPRLVDTAVMIPQLEFVGLKLSDALKTLTRAYQLSAYIDSSITGSITVRLENISLNDALFFIIKEYGLAWEKIGGIIKIYKPAPPLPVPPPLELSVDDGLLSCQLSNADLNRTINAVMDMARVNIVLENGTTGTVSGRLQQIPIEKALDILMTSNGYSLNKSDDIFYVGLMKGDGKSDQKTGRFSITCDSGRVTINVANAPLNDVVSAVSNACGVSILIRGTIDGRVSAAFAGLGVEETLASLLGNTSYTYRRDNDVYCIGPKDSPDMSVSELLLLKHLVAKDVEPLIPAALSKQVALKIVVEHNGFVAVGPKTAIDEVRRFLNTVDVPPAMVLFDVLVVDYSNTDVFQFNVLMNNTGGSQSLPTQTYYPNIDISGSGKTLNRDLDELSAHLGISKIGPLSDDFFARLQILQQQGKANVRSRPKIASLCGHSASINVGTTQYYLLESKTVYPSEQSNLSTQTSERFETIEANMSIQVTPYVNETGELIVDINPEFSTPASAFSAEVPPTINHRILKSTVRLKNGETIILGGLVQTSENSTKKKFPILGSLPLLGFLFQSTDKTTVKSELMIYITPHVYYGSDGSVDASKLYKKD